LLDFLQTFQQLDVLDLLHIWALAAAASVFKPRDPGSKGTDWSRNSQPMEWVEQILSTS